jgi:heme exporter protein A
MRLSATDLACRRGGRDVFAGVSFSVAAGASLAIRGRNGAGKSSLLRMVAGLVRVASGRLALEGGDPELTIGEQAHYLGHLDALKPSLSVAENLQFWSAFFDADNADLNADLAEALRTVGLDAVADLPAAYLSAGQRRRLSIARLLAVKRPLWLLDEPTSTLDDAAQVRLAEIMRAHLAGGGMILAATHGALGLDDARELRLADNPPPFPFEEDHGAQPAADLQASSPAYPLRPVTPRAGREQQET